MSNNVYELFSGFDDADSEIPNYWEGNLTRHEIAELKKTKRLRLQGEIGPDLFRAACNMGLEGLVSKRSARPYRAGRSPNSVITPPKSMKTRCPARSAGSRK